MVLWINSYKKDCTNDIIDFYSHFRFSTIFDCEYPCRKNLHPSVVCPIMTNTSVVEEAISQLNLTELTPLSSEVIQRQATVNIGTIGHVAHGKSTVVKAISGVQTVRFKNELERNITIKLGYANAKVR